MKREEENVPSMYEVYGEKPILASEKDTEVFFNEIENPSEPNQKLKDAAKRYSDEVRNKHTHIEDFDVNEVDLKKKS
jgi:hypothetical protein